MLVACTRISKRYKTFYMEGLSADVYNDLISFHFASPPAESAVKDDFTERLTNLDVASRDEDTWVLDCRLGRSHPFLHSSEKEKINRNVLHLSLELNVSRTLFMLYWVSTGFSYIQLHFGCAFISGMSKTMFQRICQTAEFWMGYSFPDGL